MDVKGSILSKIKNTELANAFNKVNRKDFLPDQLKKYAYDDKYADSPLTILPNITTTALTLGIYMLDSLDLHKGQKILEIGTGIGYYTALMAEIADKIVSIEINDDMYEYSKKVLNYPNIELIKGDGTLGYEKESPYDRVIAWAASPTLLCKPFDQLNEGGIMIIPIGTGKVQWLYKIVKKEGKPAIEKLSEVIFMRMRGTYGFYDDYDDPIENRIEKLERQVKSILSKLNI
jgi:protein-L-isoaspartate(D-aspartate) O-methyltransferase